MNGFSPRPSVILHFLTLTESSFLESISEDKVKRFGKTIAIVSFLEGFLERIYSDLEFSSRSSHLSDRHSEDR